MARGRISTSVLAAALAVDILGRVSFLCSFSLDPWQTAPHGIVLSGCLIRRSQLHRARSPCGMSSPATL